jgi:hypothetical protein
MMGTSRRQYLLDHGEKRQTSLAAFLNPRHHPHKGALGNNLGEANRWLAACYDCTLKEISTRVLDRW